MAQSSEGLHSGRYTDIYGSSDAFNSERTWRRLRKGTRNKDVFHPFPVNDIFRAGDFSKESPFLAQEYISLQVRTDPFDVQQITQIPKKTDLGDRDSVVYENGIAKTSSNAGSLKQEMASDSNNDDNSTSPDLEEIRPTRDSNDEQSIEQSIEQPLVEKLKDGEETVTTEVESINKKTSDSEQERKEEDEGIEQDDCELFDRNVWLYEHLRRVVMELSHPLVTSLQETCNRSTCPQMRAHEWLYLCAAHATAQENECCAIDYIVHTLDAATSLLNSEHLFPSRTHIPATSIKHFSSITRRLYRIFAHAWFHHREVFDACENETSLFERLSILIDNYNLLEPELLVIPNATQQQLQQQSSLESEFSRA